MLVVLQCYLREGVLICITFRVFSTKSIIGIDLLIIAAQILEFGDPVGVINTHLINSAFKVNYGVGVQVSSSN